MRPPRSRPLKFFWFGLGSEEFWGDWVNVGRFGVELDLALNEFDNVGV